MVVLYGNDAFSILVLSTKKRYSSFLKKFFVFRFSRKSNSKLKYWKCSTFLANKGLFWKSLVPFFRTVDFKMKPPRKLFSSVKTKTKANFAVKLAERSNHSFYCLFDESRLSNIALFNTLGAETFTGRNFRDFCPFLRKFVPSEIVKRKIAKVFYSENKIFS